MPVGAQKRDEENGGGDDQESSDLAAEHRYSVQLSAALEGKRAHARFRLLSRDLPGANAENRASGYAQGILRLHRVHVPDPGM